VKLVEQARTNPSDDMIRAHEYHSGSWNFGVREKVWDGLFPRSSRPFSGTGLRVFVPELDSTEGVEFRGSHLRDQIQAAAAARTIDSSQKTHIIAHSLGGLDSRYLLSPANPNKLQIPVRSLTTISTPHRGSPVADVVDNPLALLPFPHLPFAAGPNLLEPVLRALDISLNGLPNLTTGACQSFSESTWITPM
jgi:hypothetical protein